MPVKKSSKSIDPIALEAEKERAAIVEAQEDLYFFTRYLFKKRRKYKWRDNWHHRVVCDALMEVLRGENNRLILNIPPRYSKTELAVINFAAWSIGHFPDAEFIHASYSHRLATKNAWNIRSLVEHQNYRQVFPNLKLRQDSRAKDEWRTTEDGCFYSTGVGGTVTGYGAGKDRQEFGGAIIIDDPHKAAEARSDVIRQNVIEWYSDTLASRTNAASTPIILIMQRLHENDLAGWLLNGGSGETWKCVSLPAIDEHGEALWPHKHSLEKLRQMEAANPYVFAGQYLQRPAPPEGGFFKPTQMPIIAAVPAGGKAIRKWDLAATAGGGDWTVGLKLVDQENGRYTIADVVRLRGGAHEVEQAIVNTASRDGQDVIIHLTQDPGQAGKAQVQYLTGLLRGYTVLTDTESGDKVTRAMPVSAQVNVGNVSMAKASWNDDLMNELKLFPNGSFDDQVDALSGAFNAMSNAPYFYVWPGK